MAYQKGQSTVVGVNGPASLAPSPLAVGIDFSPSDSGSKMTEEGKQKYDLYYRKLRIFREQLPSHLLSKLPSPELKELASSLIDGTVFEIVGELEDIQKLTERSLLKKRMEVVNRHKCRRVKLARAHHQEMADSTETRPHTVPLLKAKHEAEHNKLDKKLAEEMRLMDKEIVLEFDQLVTDQQSTMQQCAVPMFTVTNNPQEVQLQMYLLRFLQKMNIATRQQPPLE